MKILMVCLGNICRSPLAHGIMQHLVEQEGLDWEIDSAGTGDWHVGNQPDKRSIAVAKKYGVDITTQRAQWFQPELFDRYDRILVMDDNNLRDVLALGRNDEDRVKVQLFLSEGIVPDPYYDETQFEPVYNMIEKRCKELLQELRK
ncbi:low molecular weight protein-tyrosine-phosphatase [Sphingobacterium sp. FBM7-1]|uniref:low molecular weight protein-tyrosine-phosphatase n=1 Tax=Sphingobacterium sp. FBM7-1 TaxID=2886688 RepID=UPI001D127D4C|nr:low molecular weight protein-tyrosine-phosphatase [Sphingobacterium sp. FBM7-1]MCC2599963.1 low molecular weight phosphotyrosine protein phosphatase [Sphingobacterium sp. FBM7-1]